MTFSRKRYRMKRRSTRGQAILEYIIIIAIVAVAALTVLGLFGDRIRQLIAGVTGALGGEEKTVSKGDTRESFSNFANGEGGGTDFDWD